MQTVHSLSDLAVEPGQTIVLEAPRVEGRDESLRTWAEESVTPSGRAWLLDCDAGKHGLWAGLDQWLLDLHPELQQKAPRLIEHHSHELVNIVPSLRRSIRSTMTTLTDAAQADESVRNYAIDRGYRLGHGVIDLLDRWQVVTGNDRWVVVCLDFDRSGALVRRFFRQLARRRARKLGLTLVLVAEPGRGSALLETFSSEIDSRSVRWELVGRPLARPDRAEARKEAEELEKRVHMDQLEVEIHLGRLIHLWESSDRPDGALPWKALALGMYNHYGFYEDAMQFVDPILDNLDSIPPIKGYEYFFTRWNLVGSVFGCLVANGYPDRALQTMNDEADGKIKSDEDQIRANYVMAMLHSRYLGEKDLGLAEEYLRRGLDLLERTDTLNRRDQVFLTVFLNNGLAFVRHRQGYPSEAIELCRSGFDRMNRDLDPSRHRLHRSVLLYNQAQVYAGIGEHEAAIEKFGQALDMDPNYSEYYNERGNVHLAIGRYEEAVSDYRRAIETSPPYPEVWTNLGQCLKRMGELDEAVEAYSRALDLDPEGLLARIGRAQALDLLERTEEAEQEYTRALALDPADPHLWANRATLRYQMGSVEASLQDLDRAVELAPEDGALYQNRAVALESLGRDAQALRDLRSYLALEPEAPDRAAVEARIQAASSGG